MPDTKPGGDPYNYVGAEARERQEQIRRALRDPSVVDLFVRMCVLRVRLNALLRRERS